MGRVDAGGAYVRGPGSEAVNIFHDLLFSLEERSRRFPGLLSFPAAFWPAMSDSLLSTLTSLRVAQSVLPEDFYDGWMGNRGKDSQSDIAAEKEFLIPTSFYRRSD